MDVTCWNCKTVTSLDAAGITAAINKMNATKLSFFDVPCSKCGKANRTQRAVFAAAQIAAPVAAAIPALAPVPAPAPAARKAKVLVRSVRVRAEHNTSSDVVAGLVHDQEVDVFETWTEGKNIWARIGEGTWAAVEYNGEKLLELK